MSEQFLIPLVGGMCIGGSAAALLQFNGRIAGISGMLRGLLASSGAQRLERLVFLAGLVVGAAAIEHYTGQLPQAREHFPGWLLVVAGVLVAIGTTLAAGCTSGHGVCGLARLSPRSAVAVATFLSVAIVTTYVVRHLFGVA